MKNPAEYESKAKKEYTSIVILKAYIKKVTKIEEEKHIFEDFGLRLLGIHAF